MENSDDTILDSIRLDGLNHSQLTGDSNSVNALKNAKCSNGKNAAGQRNSNASSSLNHRHHHHHNHKQSKASSNGLVNESPSGHHITSKNKKAKRLPWNIKVLEDRFTPQTYLVQLIDFCLNSLINRTESTSQNFKNVLVFLRNEEYKNYLKIMIIKQYALYLNVSKNKKSQIKLILLITNMGSNVSKYVEIVSRHTTLKLAGIDLNVMNSTSSEADFFKLKKEADILIMSVNILVEWFKKGLLALCEIDLIIFDEVSAAFHNNAYKTFMETYFKNCTIENDSPKIFGFGSLDIDRTTTHVQVKHHIEYLKDLFKCVNVETATDLLDTQNMLYGFEPKECIQICENSSIFQQQVVTGSVDSTKSSEFKLIDKIKESYIFLEETNASSNLFNENLTYIHLLCIRVLNECVYLLNEVGIWCLAKSLLPFICQLDKIAYFIENTATKNNQNHDFKPQAQDKNMPETQKIGDHEVTILNDSNLQQQLILQYTSTCLKDLREMCIKEFLNSKTTTNQIPQVNNCDNFLNRFSTPKVKCLINLLRQYNQTSDEFCCLIFVQNKQVATSLSLLLRKLAKEDPMLSYLYPNYVIGSNNSSSSASRSNQSCASTAQKSEETISNSENNNATSSNSNSDGFKQEEILRKFYSGEINLLICTYEMEENISSPSCVNLIIRFNCNVNTDTTNNLNDHLPFDYFSYIGTKTRAKSKNAYCYFFIEQNYFDSFFRQFSKFKQIENTLIKKYSQLIKINEGDNHLKSVSINDNTPKIKYISVENAIYLINRYCVRLPSDALTQLSPRFECISRTSHSNNKVEYKCSLYLPVNSSIHDPIQSDWEADLHKAKTKAAFRACLVLYLKNELNDMLEPITKEMFYKQNHRNDEDDEKEWSQFSHIFQKSYQNHHQESLNQQISNYMSHRPGGNKRKQVYAKKISPYLQSLQLVSTQHPSYLYIIKSTLTIPLTNDSLNESSSDNDFINMNKSWYFGLLTSKPLLEIVDFPIFTPNGEETVKFELIKSSIFLTPNQFKLIKSFHKFLFSNVLRMDTGRGAVASQHLTNNTINSQNGYYMCIIIQNLINNEYDFDWDLMKKVDGCTDRQFLKVPSYIRRISDEEKFESNVPEEPKFKFDKKIYFDSVVIPFYRINDSQPQFYCVTSIDFNSNPLSKFPLSSHTSSSQYETFYEYFALKYDILITDIMQPLLYVSHPSTRLNLLTPRYMNMKASVLQKTYTHQRFINNNSAKSISEKKTSTNRIYLIPELVNVHPFSATVWRRCLCLPSILYRLNCLLVVEELRREIAQSTGVGLPWISDQNFEKLSFLWDTNKEIEMSGVPDVEIDIATIQQINETDNKNKNSKSDENGTNLDPNWNFEISEWDDSCLKESNSASATNFSNKIFETLTNTTTSTNSSHEKTNNFNSKIGSTGWIIDDSILNNPKTLFIDPNDMEFFGDDLIDTDEEEPESVLPKKNPKVFKSKKVEVYQKHDKQFIEDDDEFDDENDDEFYDENFTDEQSTKVLNPEELKLKFTIDLNTLKADMKKKSAKLISKLSVNSNNCYFVKSLVKGEPIAPKVSDYSITGSKKHNEISCLSIADELVFNLENLKPNENMNILELSKKETVNKSSFIDFDFANDLELNDWFSSIEFKFDSNKKTNNSKIIDKFKSQLLDDIQEKNGSKSENLTNLSVQNQNEKIFLPLNKIEIEKFFLTNEQLDIKNYSQINRNSFKNLQPSSPSSISTASLRNTDWTFPYFMDDNARVNYTNQIGPGPALLLQALTLSNAADGFDLERLETVGDSFLKQAITVYLFFAYPDVHEGKLSYLRSKQVSNYNLYKLGKRRGIHELIISTKFEPLDSWLPSHYDSIASVNNLNLNKAQTKASNSAQILLSSLLSKPTSKNTASATTDSSSTTQTIQFDKYKEHLVSDKSIADTVEAIIGAYLITSGPQAALQIMSWFGLEVLPKAKCAEDGAEVLINIPHVPPPKISDHIKLKELIDGYEAFEACIGYKFKQPAYLLQAFTHASYTYNTVTDCYQRLEFLGDAILDYVITRHLYEDKQRIHSPGELTDLRSALVNNNIFAYLAVKYEFYKYFKYFSPTLYVIIDNFVLNQKKRNDEFDLEEDFFDFPLDDDDDDGDEEDEFLLMNNMSDNDIISKNNFNNDNDIYNQQNFLNLKTNELEEMEVPKCLGDIFESVAGAIFLDSDKSFDTVWRVYYGLMKPHIDKFTSKVPKSPIRELFELEPETAKFEKPERTIDGKIRVTVSVFGRGKFKGLGRNYRIAKNAAAKLALKFLKNQSKT